MACTLASVETVGGSSEPPAPSQAGAARAAPARAAPAAPAATSAATSAPTAQQADLLGLLSVEGARRTGGNLRAIVSQFAGVEGLVGLHVGLPPTSSFPITSLQFGLADGRTVQLSAAQLAAAQQYNLGPAGYPPLLAWVKAHVQELHAPQGGHAFLITDSASHGLEVRCGCAGRAGRGCHWLLDLCIGCHWLPASCC
jgi:kynurenine/2-aminoadipate aminotransferase